MKKLIKSSSLVTKQQEISYLCLWKNSEQQITGKYLEYFFVFIKQLNIMLKKFIRLWFFDNPGFEFTISVQVAKRKDMILH